LKNSKTKQPRRSPTRQSRYGDGASATLQIFREAARFLVEGRAPSCPNSVFQQLLDRLPTVRTRTALLIVVMLACGCAHTTLTSATFSHEAALSAANKAAATDHNHLVLQITRHVDTIINGPDIDEDQLLVLDLKNFRLQQRLAIPSAEVVPRLSVTRFGPSSEGREFRGFLIVKKISPSQIQAYVHLDVVAQTRDRSYSQKVRFRGNFKFFRGTQENEGGM
jgi:hypothetical protein